MAHTVQHQESGSKGAFFVVGPSGARLAEMTYSRTNESLIIIDHTEVDPSLSGQGVGRELLDALVGWARSSKTKVMPTSSMSKHFTLGMAPNPSLHPTRYSGLRPLPRAGELKR